MLFAGDWDFWWEILEGLPALLSNRNQVRQLSFPFTAHGSAYAMKRYPT